jgi:hypothetical protein
VIRALALAWLAVSIVTGAAFADTVTLGRGMPPWKLGRSYVQGPGLVRSERIPANARPGCAPGVGSASRIDYYRGLRVAWRSNGHGHLYLVDVATSRAGDRSSDGFVISVSTRGAVSRRHPGARVSFRRGPLSLGPSSITVLKRTGKETFDTLVYWFDARGVLTALEAFAGGC